MSKGGDDREQRPHVRQAAKEVDVGAPMLAMHSCREVASALDVPLMVRALTACLQH